MAAPRDGSTAPVSGLGTGSRDCADDWVPARRPGAFKRDLGMTLTPADPAEAALIEARRFGMARGR